MNDTPAAKPEPGITCLGKAVILLFILACLGAGAYLLVARYAAAPAGAGGSAAGPASSPNATAPAQPAVEFGFAYGTEKADWLKWAVAEYAKTPGGASVKINLIPMGSLEGVEAVVKGDTRIQAFAPASSLVRDVLVQQWQARGGSASPILREESLALTPLVFVFWAERYEAFVKKYGEVNFRTIGEALSEPSGWDGIAAKPEWGVFKFGHTSPRESNSGLMTLVLMAFDFRQKTGRTLTLDPKDILDPKFVEWMGKFENAVSGFSNSTGNQMRDMVLRGPSTYDGLSVYESVAIDYLKRAEGRWGELRVVYPERNLWNDNPCYVLDVDWSTPEQRKAAGAFLDYLLSDPVQREALGHGFRPANLNVPVKFPDSPFTVYAKNGLRADASVQNGAVSADVIDNLLAIWQRTRK